MNVVFKRRLSLRTVLEEKKEKKEKKPKEEPAQAEKKAEAPKVEENVISKLDIRVGKIVKVWPHPDSDKYIVLVLLIG